MGSLIPWQRYVILSLSQDTDLASYVDVLVNGVAPAVNPPAAYNGNVGARLQQHAIEYKKYLGNMERVPKRNGRFIAIILKSCDTELRNHVQQSLQFQAFMREIPINVIGAFNLICEKAVCEPCHLARLCIDCESYLRRIKMRQSGESVQRFIGRFNDTQYSCIWGIEPENGRDRRCYSAYRVPGCSRGGTWIEAFLDS